jgi:hypothetical protein
MRKKTVFILSVMLLCLGAGVYLKAQNSGDDRSFIQIMMQRFTDLEAKIDKLSPGASAAKSGTRNQEILSKLEQVLANQQKILQELEVVKVRATRK